MKTKILKMGKQLLFYAMWTIFLLYVHAIAKTYDF
jgi:hypothetical protein